MRRRLRRRAGEPALRRRRRAAAPGGARLRAARGAARRRGRARRRPAAGRRRPATRPEISLLALEIGHHAGRTRSGDLLGEAGFEQVERLRDLAGHERVIVGRRDEPRRSRRTSSRARRWRGPVPVRHGLRAGLRSRERRRRSSGSTRSRAGRLTRRRRSCSSTWRRRWRQSRSSGRDTGGAAPADAWRDHGAGAQPRHRFPLACRADPETLGCGSSSVPALAGVRIPVLQSSANLSGGADARRSERGGAGHAGRRRSGDRRGRAAGDAVDGGRPARIREPAASGRCLRRPAGRRGERSGAALEGRFRFDPSTYAAMVARRRFRRTSELQEQVAGDAAATACAADPRPRQRARGRRRSRLLERHPAAAAGRGRREPDDAATAPRGAAR